MLDLIGDTRFLDDPLVTHSAKFALARPVTARISTDGPSIVAVRPWNLRGVVPTGAQTAAAIVLGSYDHGQQVSVDSCGHRLFEIRADDPSADSVSNNDGDEGASEDWKYDFAPDYGIPVPVA